MPTIYKDLLISPNDEGLLSYVEENYDRRQLTEIIWDAQELYLLPILGSALYDEMKAQSRANNFSANNLILLEKINPCLKWYTLASGAHIFTYKIRSKGIVTQTSDNAQPSTLSEINFLVNDFKNKAEVFGNRLKNFLIQNSDTYPLYFDSGDGVDTIHPTNSAISGGWVFDKSNPFCNDETNNSIPL